MRKRTSAVSISTKRVASDRILVLEKELAFLVNYSDQQEWRLHKLESWMRANLGYFAELDVDTFPLPNPLTPIQPSKIYMTVPSGIIKSEIIFEDEKREHEYPEGHTSGSAIKATEIVGRTKPDSLPEPAQGLPRNGFLEEPELTSSSNETGVKRLTGDSIMEAPAAMEVRESTKTKIGSTNVLDKQGTSNTSSFPECFPNSDRTIPLIPGIAIHGIKIPKATPRPLLATPNDAGSSFSYPAPNAAYDGSVLFHGKTINGNKGISNNSKKRMVRKKLKCFTCGRKFETDGALKQHSQDKKHAAWADKKRTRNKSQFNGKQASPSLFDSFVPSKQNQSSKQPLNPLHRHQNPSQNPQASHHSRYYTNIFSNNSSNHSSTTLPGPTQTPGQYSQEANKKQTCVLSSMESQVKENTSTSDFISRPFSKHEPQKPRDLHSCNVCLKNFAEKSSLVQHSRTHATVIPTQLITPRTVGSIRSAI